MEPACSLSADPIGDYSLGRGPPAILRKCCRRYLLSGEMEDVRLPPLTRNPEGTRRSMPDKRSRGPARKVKYFSKLAADLEVGKPIIHHHRPGPAPVRHPPLENRPQKH